MPMPKRPVPVRRQRIAPWWWPMRRAIILRALVVAIIAAPAWAQSPAGDRPLAEILGAVADFIAIERARKGAGTVSDAADVLIRLEQLLDQFQAPAAVVWLDETFADGDLRRNPTWHRLSGSWRVRRGELRALARVGQLAIPQLQTAGQAAPITAPGRDPAPAAPDELALLTDGEGLVQRLLHAMTGDPAANDDPDTAIGVLRLDQALPASFTLKVSLRQLSQTGAMSLALQENAASDRGYRLVLRPGAQPLATLYYETPFNTQLLGHSGPAQLSRVQLRRYTPISWQRSPAGDHIVTIGNTVLLRQHHAGMEAAPAAFELINIGGEFSLQSIKITGPASLDEAEQP